MLDLQQMRSSNGSRLRSDKAEARGSSKALSEVTQYGDTNELEAAQSGDTNELEGELNSVPEQFE